MGRLRKEEGGEGMSVSKQDIRWSDLMANLESVRESAFWMEIHGDITERQYDIFNDGIWKLEKEAKKLMRTSE